MTETPETPETLCGALGYITVGGRNVGLVRCTQPAGHDGERLGYFDDEGNVVDYYDSPIGALAARIPPTPHSVTLAWADDSPGLAADDWPEAHDPDEAFDVEVEVDDTDLTQLSCFDASPHAAHDWTLYYVEPPAKHRCPGRAERPDEAAKADRSTRPGSRCQARMPDGARCIASSGHDFGHVALTGERWDDPEPPTHLFGR